MKSSMMLFSENFGQRILIRRSYLAGKKTNIEAALVLAELLNLSFLSQKKGYARLAGGELSYKLYSYRSGYVLETSLFQTKAKGLSYIFKNPYKAGLEMIAHFDKDNLLTDEKSFAVAKERLVSKKNFASSALSSLLGNIHADYSSPVFDEKKVKDVKIEEVLSLLDAFLNSDTGDYFYLGEEEKKDPFYQEKDFEEDLSSLPFSSLSLEKREFEGKGEKEGRLYLLQLGKEIKSEKDCLTDLQALFVLEEDMKKEIRKGFGSDVLLSSSILSPSLAYLYVETEKGKFSLLEDKLPLKENEAVVLHDPISYDDSFVGFNKKILSRSIYSSSALKDMILYKDLALNAEKDSFFKKATNEKEEVLSALSLMKTVTYVSLINRKDENHD